MSYRGRWTWPPDWMWVSGNYDKNPDSEAGILENLKPSVVNDCCLFLTMSYGGGRYVASLFLDDSQFCLKVCELLLQHYGESIKTIGEIDIR
jgi:hypothetical protein